MSEPYSLKHRLSAISVGIFLFGALFLHLASLISDINNEKNNLHDAIEFAANELVVHVAELAESNPEMDEYNPTEMLEALGFDEWFATQIWYQDRLIFSSNDVLPDAIPSELGLTTEHELFSDTDDFSLLFHVNEPTYNIHIVLWDSYVIFDELIDRTREHFLWLLLVIPCLLIIYLYFSKNALSPLQTLTKRLQRNDIDNLKQVELDGMPIELHPPINMINSLFIKISELQSKQTELIDSEKRFTRNAAHELLTPLAALKTHIQVSLKHWDQNDFDKPDVLNTMLDRIERSSHVIEQLVLLASSESSEQDFQPVKLNSIVEDSSVELGEKIETKALNFSFEAEENLYVSAQPDQLYMLVKNLITNAVNYTPDGGDVVISMFPTSDHIYLQLLNDCVYFPAYFEKHAFEPFVRGQSAQASGAGLGLSICKAICKKHNADITITRVNDGEQVKVVVVFPLMS